MTEIPETLKVYQTIAEFANRQGVLDQKTQELISLAVAVTTRCDGCISIHSQAALKAGASREEIAAALAVAVSLNAGAAVVYSSHVMEAINQ
ncbi:TPA: carboxymuconolactone decarboxylase family protein [Klebsiella pneumoniae]|nr:carboxymuconolactone decarboxylase family protein [Klebsiella pneumoniae]HDY9362067.1 carboxymuconolactone decarboxylase family protein [Klebsiella pneumoniae]